MAAQVIDKDAQGRPITTARREATVFTPKEPSYKQSDSGSNSDDANNAPASAPAPTKSAPQKGGDGGVTSGGAGNYTGTMMATLPNGAQKEVQYVNGQLVTKLADGSVVHTQGGDYTYSAPKYDDDPATAGSKTASNNNVIDLTSGTVDISGLRNWLSQQNTAAKQAAQKSIDYATNQGIEELRRAEEDAKVQFDAQRNQINIDEARAKDNQALYAEVRGNRGGIGAAQYDAIMNTAAQNRLAVNQAQTKLATDTARAIADLRAKGEFEKADALLELTQNYLGQLISLEQWALNYGVSVAQFKQGLDQWDAEFALQEAQITGVYKGQPIATKSSGSAPKGSKYDGWTDESFETVGKNAKEIKNDSGVGAVLEYIEGLCQEGLDPNVAATILSLECNIRIPGTYDEYMKKVGNNILSPMEFDNARATVRQPEADGYKDKGGALIWDATSYADYLYEMYKIHAD